MGKLNAALINRTKKPSKLSDGAALSFVRNKDGSLSAFQRVVGAEGKTKDLVVAKLDPGEFLTEEHLFEIRASARRIKKPLKGNALTFKNLWGNFCEAVMTAPKPIWTPETRIKNHQRMLKYLSCSSLWDMPVNLITPQEVEEAMKLSRREAPLLSSPILNDIRRAFAWAMVDGAITTNPAETYRQKLKLTETIPTYKPYAAETTLENLRAIIRKIKGSNLSGPLRAALLFQAMTCQRSGEVCSAQWGEIDLEKRIWVIPRSRMKVKDRDQDHIVPLSGQAISLLTTLEKTSDWLFESPMVPGKPMRKELFSQGMIRLGYVGIHTPHGWRSALRTLANDSVDLEGRPMFAHRWVEDILDHSVKGVEAHYTRTKALEGMRRVLDWWGQILEVQHDSP